MKNKLAVIFTFLLVFSASSGAADRLSYIDLIGRLTDLQYLATLPKPGEQCVQWSSYDIAEIRELVGDRNAIAAVSGGVDSSVAALLVAEAIGDQLTAIFVDNGVLRKNEAVQVARGSATASAFTSSPSTRRERFYRALAGIEDPETKRKRIGNEFIAVFEEEAKQIPDVEFLVQGTLYPDVIESVSIKGPSAVIKTHHNVGGLPEKMGFKLIEPLRELFKDEVRRLGDRARAPKRSSSGAIRSPGPGLAVRILGEVTPRARRDPAERRRDLHRGDPRRGALREISQAFAVLLPVKTRRRDGRRADVRERRARSAPSTTATS